MQSNHNYKKSNAHVTSRKFWDSLTKVMALQNIELESKVTLVRFKKNISEHIQEVAEVMKGMADEEVAELMKKEYSTEVKPVNIDLNELTADDLYQLDGLVNLEV